MNIERARESRRWLAHWSGLYSGMTPLFDLPDLSRKLAFAQLSVKDESRRSPLGSFKALGAPIALARLLMRRAPDKGYTPQELFSGRHAADLQDFVVIAATDGNHGRALAAAARTVGCGCVIVLHENVSRERETPIAALGARIVRSQGDYDNSVKEAVRLAEQSGWHVVSDTSYEGYEDIPRDVMQGYAVIADEVLEQADGEGDAPPFTHVFLQAGVGALAAGIVSYFHERYGPRRPTFLVVEPDQADCLYQSAIAGRPAHATGVVDSLMAGLACGAASPLAWRFLEGTVDAFVTVEDSQVPPAMRALAEGSARDTPIVSGESGAAGLAALLQIADSQSLRADVGLDASSRVLLINTEGDTAPAIYTNLVGRRGAAVREAQAAWPHRTRAT